jgi:TPR repeat protein
MYANREGRMFRYLVYAAALFVLASPLFMGFHEAPPLNRENLEERIVPLYTAKRYNQCARCGDIPESGEAGRLVKEACRAEVCSELSDEELEKPVMLYIEAARLGSPEANWRLGRMAAKSDEKVAMDYLKRAALAGHHRAQADYAIYLLAQGEVDAAGYWFEKSVSGGNPSSVCIYHYGLHLSWLGKSRNDADMLSRGCALLLQAARDGEYAAQQFVVLNSPGPCAHDLAWFLAKAEAGFSKYYCMAGLMYEEGRGVSRDPETAEDWYKKAARHGSTTGLALLSLLYEKDGHAQ